VFKISPTYLIELEACIPPVKCRFDKICKFYALRVLKMQPDHPIRKTLNETVSIPLTNITGGSLSMSRIAPTANKRPQLTKIMNIISVKYGYYKLESFDHQLNWP
jgi:hypothetical protein